MKWVFATNNRNKVREVKALVPKGMEILSLRDIGCEEELPETHETIEENSLEKAVYVREKYGYPCFAEDSGLEVDALHGDPGVYSARYAGTGIARDNILRLLRELQGEESRAAQFKTVFTLAGEDFMEQFTGIIRGQITEMPSGESGFGYDPVFLPDGYTETFAAMPADIKQAISHRGQAFKRMTDFLRDRFAF